MAQLDSIDRTVVERGDPLVGSVLDSRYLIHERIAAGGFATIYRASHISSKHEFAIKILHANLVHDDRVVARFRREAAAMHELRDKHTITFYELNQTPDGTYYIVMELLRGESLYERFRARGPLTWQATVAIARAICSSLGEAHARGIIHRDLKPANIHLERRGDERDFVKVLDFGIVRVSETSDLDSSELTQAGQVIGTFDYMSPEQMVGGECSPRSDIYALGVLMYELICGSRPFAEAGSLTSLLATVLTGTPQPLGTRVAIPPSLDRVVMRCLEREPQQRFADVAELSAELEQVFAVEEPVTRRISVSMIEPEISSADDVTRIAVRPPSARPRVPTPPPPLPPPRAPSPSVVVAPQRLSTPALPVVPADPVRHQAVWNLSPVGPPPTPMPAARGSSIDLRPYDMAEARARDLMMRRLVLALSLALVGLLALVIAGRL